MGGKVLVDSGFIVALLTSGDRQHEWAVRQATEHDTPWRTCEAVLSEAYYLLGPQGWPALAALLRRGAVLVSFDWQDEQDRVLALMNKYSDVPMSLADACVVRMTEVMPRSVVLTTDGDFRVYRRYGREVIPFIMPE
jgi:predicted nucleic acid-binding protein